MRMCVVRVCTLTKTKFACCRLQSDGNQKEEAEIERAAGGRRCFRLADIGRTARENQSQSGPQSATNLPTPTAAGAATAAIHNQR